MKPGFLVSFLRSSPVSSPVLRVPPASSPRRLFTGRPDTRGFTLLELIVTVVIATILSTMVITTWQRHVRLGWRVQARAAMVEAMLGFERHAMTAMSFGTARGSATPAGTWPQVVPPLPSQPRYWLYAEPCPRGDLDTCVELRAIPEAPDPACGTLILRSSGEWLAAPAGLRTPIALPPGC